MQIKEIMTENPQCCTSDTSVEEVAKLMKQCDCGAIPVVDDLGTKRPIGVITDRDIAIRAVAKGKNPSQTQVAECMTRNPITVKPDTSIEECARIMEEKQVRRLVVVDENGKCCGIAVQAQIARMAPKELVAEMMRKISQPAPEMARA